MKYHTKVGEPEIQAVIVHSTKKHKIIASIIKTRVKNTWNEMSS